MNHSWRTMSDSPVQRGFVPSIVPMSGTNENAFCKSCNHRDLPKALRGKRRGRDSLMARLLPIPSCSNCDNFNGLRPQVNAQPAPHIPNHAILHATKTPQKNLAIDAHDLFVSARVRRSLLSIASRADSSRFSELKKSKTGLGCQH